MNKYGKPIWKLVLDAALELNIGVFSASDIVKKINQTIPQVPDTTIRTYVIAMAPNHPTSHRYQSTHKNHRYFYYLGKGRYRFLAKKDPLEIKPNDDKKKLPITKKDRFLTKYSGIILSWTEDNFNSIITGRKEYRWGKKTPIECVNERNRISRLIISSRIKNNGAIDFDTINEVMIWGGFSPFRVDKRKELLEKTSKAFSYLDEGNISKAIVELISIDRVGISTASKIIGLFDQNCLAIYDSRVGTALRTLQHNGKRLIKCPAGRSRPGDNCLPERWAKEYENLLWTLEVMRNLLNQKGYPFSIADIEMALFMMGK